MKVLSAVSLAAGMLLGVSTAVASPAPGNYLMVVDSGQNRVMLFDPMNGSLVQQTYIDLDPLGAGTPKAALQVGNEVWVSDQLRDRIDRFDLSGNYLSTIGGQVPGGGLDNIRGMAMVNGEIYVANAGTNNDAPGNSIVRIDTNGNILGNIAMSDSPWQPLAWGDNFLLSFSGTNSRIGEFDTGGNENPFYQGNANFIQQINYNSSTGGVYAAAFSGTSTRGIYEMDANGNQVNFWNVGPARGVHELGNGNIMWTDGSAVDVLDPLTGITESVWAESGSFQFISMLTIPGPGGALLVALAGVAGTGRRRRA